MVISSRTPEGQPNHCPMCGSYLTIEPSNPAGEAPCPQCGNLLWFAAEDLGAVQVVKPTGSQLEPESWQTLIDWVAMRSGTRLVINLSDVEYLTSSDLGKLINLKRKLTSRGVRLSLQHVHPDLMDVFRLTRLDNVFSLEP